MFKVKPGKTWNVNPTLKHLCTSASKHNREGKKKQSKPNVISYFAGRYVFCIQNIRFRCSMTFTLVIKRNLSVAGPDLHIRVGGGGVHTLWWGGGGFQNFFVFGPSDLNWVYKWEGARAPRPPGSVTVFIRHFLVICTAHQRWNKHLFTQINYLQVSDFPFPLASFILECAVDNKSLYFTPHEIIRKNLYILQH